MEKIITKRITKFDANPGEDFNMWALRFEVLCDANEVADVVYSDAIGTIAEDALLISVKKKIAKARMLLVQSLTLKALITVAGEKKNSFKMYKKLEERYATNNVATRVQLQTQLHQMRFSSTKTMGEYIDSLEVLLNKLDAMDSGVGESIQVATLLASFGNIDGTPCGPVVSALQTLGGDKLTWGTATARLLQEYNTRDTASTSQNGSQKTEVRRALKSVARVKCFNCRKYGHYQRDCKQPRRDRCRFGVEHGPSNDDEKKALMAKTFRGQPQTFIIDSAASSQKVNDRRLISSPIRSVPMTVSLGDGAKLDSGLKGTVYVSIAIRWNPL